MPTIFTRVDRHDPVTQGLLQAIKAPNSSGSQGRIRTQDREIEDRGKMHVGLN